MKTIPLSLLPALFAIGGLLPARSRAQQPAAPAGWFQENAAWTQVRSVALAGDSAQFETTGKNAGALLCHTGAGAGEQLRSHAYLGDCVLRMEFMLTADADAGVYLEGRYKIRLGAGGLGTFAATEKTGASDPAVPAAPPVAVPAKPGHWQMLEARFRAPRFDDARNRTESALILEVKIDGQVVQSNTVAAVRSPGSEFDWDDAAGPVTIGVDRGHLALREFSVRRADFDAVKLPETSGSPTNTARLVDFVKQGEQDFHAFGCVECHATEAGDREAKTGPNLFGVFTLKPRDVAISAGGHRFTVKTDRAYLQRSLRTPSDELAIAENGPTPGQPYPAVMPPYGAAVVSDQQIDALLSYLMTLNEPFRQGPVIRLVAKTGVKNYDPTADRLQLLVDRTVRIQRGPMEKVSARAINVGLPNGINYSFDPRVLAIAKIWQGGFLDMAGEFLNRGGQGLKPGFESREIGLGPTGVLVAPLNARGQPIDFTFKDAIFGDAAAVHASLMSTEDHLDRLKAIDAQFLGYDRDSRDPAAAPVFRYRIGRNVVAIRTDFSADGAVRIQIDGTLAGPQSFAINENVLGPVTVSAGAVRDGRWTLPAGSPTPAIAHGRIALAKSAWHPKPSTFDYHHQPLEVEPSAPTLPPGYTAERYFGPKDNYGREQLFEPLGMAVAPDGTLVVTTRTAGIWRLIKNEWTFFAGGLFDSLGVQVEDQHGFTVVAGQKAELTRVSDTNGDGLADSFATMTDAFSYHGNYHSYLHGPVRDAHGDYFITLNLDDAGGSDNEYRANGKYMGTAGGFRGWAIRVPPQGGFEPWANGMRSPASLGVAPDGRIWYADNQGEYVGTSKLFVLKKGAFYGHPAGLVDLPGMTPDSPEIAWDRVKSHRESAVVLFPQSRLANSPGNPAWDTTGGRFGPFAGQMMIGDQTQSVLMRVGTEKVGDHEQGFAIPFATNLDSGVMRPVFLPDGSLLLGETGRGWQAKGGKVASLQHIVWDGKTVPPAIHDVAAVPDGFELHFTVGIPAGRTEADLARALALSSWVYRDAPDYGSPELDEHPETVTRVEIGAGRTSLHIVLAQTAQPRVHPDQTARVYRITLDSQPVWGETGPGFDAFYTLYAFPSAAK
jgi:cytochrome c2